MRGVNSSLSNKHLHIYIIKIEDSTGVAEGGKFNT
jgi:hypothetical protein